ncbi:hypothetical protein JL1_4 [Escherichia phage JL1]|uniref:Uncharacterized protein n=1 Tax=Escherichia phage JL1 TaxID=2681620 RepID=K4NXA7_9CAUD|nr:hypothetical protein D873_gp04 [Escherichia phage JL1]AFV51281.1 hypothetical protein JL1_4 [Escherichia phage JL1]
MAAGYINSQITMPINAAVVQIANTQISLRAILITPLVDWLQYGLYVGCESSNKKPGINRA